ncbi:hypothetical protein LSH36_167g02003 [Paralvinella palmiformis]|uniref:Uncharacterized protein n=1 Tax=Paralvinella palmiformis TaxID=53620 RepID=A0AAD9N913_9ANNE|nr:hypothetical protein LSH36_167g02003 [Paralvinella palmiformis]
MRDTTLVLLTIPTLCRPRPRTRKTESATILTSSFKHHLESRQEGNGKSTGKDPAKKVVARANRSKKVDESSDE